MLVSGSAVGIRSLSVQLFAHTPLLDSPAIRVLRLEGEMARSKTPEQQQREQHPTEPWLWREDWVSRRMVYSNRSRGLGLLLFALFWTGFGSAMAYLFIQNHSTPFRWLMLLIPFSGLLFLYGGVRLAILGFRYPQFILVLDKVPLRPGERFAARVEARSIPDGKIRTSLSCIHWPRREQEETIWTDDHGVARYEVHGTPLVIPIHFVLPIHARETSESDEIIWRLSVEIGGVPGSPDVKGTFEVPVFEPTR